MSFLAAMALIVFALLTMILLLVVATTDRFHRKADLWPWQFFLGLAGVAFALPLVITGDGVGLLGLSVVNVLRGIQLYVEARRERGRV